MTWLDILSPLFFGALLSYLCFHLGAAVEHGKQASREEAIRLQAFQDGRKSMRKSIFDEQIERMSMMAPELLTTPEQWVTYHITKWTPPEKHKTKESS